MIVRTVGDFHYLTRQMEHARHTGVIAAHLHPEFLGPPEFQWLTLEAAAIHDLGWEDWDSCPAFLESGLPVNFDSMEKADHREIWRRAIFEALPERGPAVAAILARHAGMLAGDEEENEFLALLPALRDRAWGDAPEQEREFFVERAFHALAFADLLSLIPAAGWAGEHRWTLVSKEQESQELTVSMEPDSWEVTVDPWPFCTESLTNVWIDSVAAPAGMEGACADWLKDPRERLVRRSIDYVPSR